MAGTSSLGLYDTELENACFKCACCLRSDIWDSELLGAEDESRPDDKLSCMAFEIMKKGLSL